MKYYKKILFVLIGSSFLVNPSFASSNSNSNLLDPSKENNFLEFQSKFNETLIKKESQIKLLKKDIELNKLKIELDKIKKEFLKKEKHKNEKKNISPDEIFVKSKYFKEYLKLKKEKELENRNKRDINRKDFKKREVLGTSEFLPSKNSIKFLKNKNKKKDSEEYVSKKEVDDLIKKAKLEEKKKFRKQRKNRIKKIINRFKKSVVIENVFGFKNKFKAIISINGENKHVKPGSYVIDDFYVKEIKKDYIEFINNKNKEKIKIYF